MILIILGLIGAAVLLGDDSEVSTERKSDTGKEKKGKKYSKTFILAAGRWLKENKPPEDWDGSKLEYAATEMQFDGEVYE